MNAGINDVAYKVAEYTCNHGGGTFNPSTGETYPNGGYVVSINPECEYIVPLIEFSAEHVARYLDMVRPVIDAWNHSGNDVRGHSLKWVGTWVNDGNVYLDVVCVLSSKYRALWLAKKYNQLAIYDIANGVEITVEGNK